MNDKKEQFEREEGECIAEFIEKYATIESGHKKEGEEPGSWVLTGKGEKLHRILLLNAESKGLDLHGYEELDIGQYTGIKWD